MIISYNWLQTYLPEIISVENLSEILTSIGLEVESIETIEVIKGGLKGVLVGEVMTCEPHPNADKLKLTTVNIGKEQPLSIVCGAPNVAAGQKVLVATLGTILYPDGEKPFPIKAAKIRGVDSEGMLCAEDELGIGKSHEGILVLPQDTLVGLPASEYFNLGESSTVIEIGLTPNRSDAMSHLGVARDVCTYLTHHRQQTYQVQYPISTIPNAENTLPINVKIEDEEKCPRYAGLVIQNVKVEPSPEWLQKRLQSIGQKPINNIVDITNFVLHEYGHPLHAFDYDKITGQTIIVKTVAKDTPFTTLDKQEIKLHEEDLMICNAEQAMCIAGVMGGAASGVQESTQSVFIEAAYFHPKAIRRTSMRHQLRTEAATHFEKQVSVENVIPVLNRAVSLILEIAGGHIASSTIDIYPKQIIPTEISFRYDYIHLLCGKEYSKSAVDGILRSMDFEILKSDEKECTVKVPFTKADVKQAADIAEEILRIDGLNNVPIAATMHYSLSTTPASAKLKWKNKIAQWLSDKGCNEILTNSIVSSKNYPDETKLVTMLNSLSSELDAMRPDMNQSGLEVLAYNINRGEKNLALYEWGNIYHQFGVGKYNQQERLAIWTTGLHTQAQWQVGKQAHDIYYLKGLINGLAKRIGIAEKITTKTQYGKLVLLLGKKEIGSIQELSPETLKKAGIKQAVFYADLYITEWWQTAEKGKIIYQEINKYPAVERDLSLVLDKNVDYASIEQLTKEQQIPYLQKFQLFDIFEGEKIGADKRAWALNYIFQADEKTLADHEVDAGMQQLIQAYEQKLAAAIRK